MLTVDIQNASSAANIPGDEQLREWVALALRDKHDKELSIRIVDRDEIQALNHQYRHKNTPTNVLSFPCELPPEIDVPLLGDIVICAQVVQEEAAAQQKTDVSHWAHIVVHGTLHLLGYDHMDDAEAHEMESLEIEILDELGFPNPYVEPPNMPPEH